MRAERPLLRIGEYLVGRACRRLPRSLREERYREWVAELPAILHDPQIGSAPRRAVRMLGYAADTLRAAALTRVRGRHPLLRRAAFGLLVFSVAVAIWDIRAVVGSPGDPLGYLRLAWAALLVAFPLSLLRSTLRVSTLILSGGTLLGAAVNLWEATRAPADWGNYLAAAFLFLCVPAIWLTVWIVSRQRLAPPLPGNRPSHRWR